jgi:CRP/FNR family transcriptional regulator, cyclic AMP receptor protein
VHERCRLLAIHRDAFEDLLFVHKELAYEVLWNVVRLLSRRLRETNDRLAMVSPKS